MWKLREKEAYILSIWYWQVKLIDSLIINLRYAFQIQ
jgi:hypothetical protein